MKVILIILTTLTGGYCSTYEKIIQMECAQYGAWSNILYSVAIEESELNPFACNKDTKSHGLMQIRKIAREEYARLYGTVYSADDMYDFKINIKVAHGLLVELARLWDGDLYMALASYHAGRQKVIDKGVISHAYVRNILSRINQQALLSLSLSAPQFYQNAL